MKKCPYCAEDVQDEAIVCRFCGREIGTPWEVVLISSEVKINTIKFLRERFDLSLTKAKELTDKPSVLASNLTIAEAGELKTDLEALGGQVEIRMASTTGEKRAASPAPQSSPATAASAHPQTNKTRSALSCVGLVIFLIIAVIVIGSTLLNSGDNDKPGHSSPAGAWVECKNQVKDRLKAPSTAKFPIPLELDEVVTDLGDGHYRVIGYVDAENSFGAALRVTFSCDLQYQSDGKWVARSVTLDE